MFSIISSSWMIYENVVIITPSNRESIIMISLIDNEKDIYKPVIAISKMRNVHIKSDDAEVILQ